MLANASIHLKVLKQAAPYLPSPHTGEGDTGFHQNDVFETH